MVADDGFVVGSGCAVLVGVAEERQAGGDGVHVVGLLLEMERKGGK